jgi:hypothetical protein
MRGSRLAAIKFKSLPRLHGKAFGRPKCRLERPQEKVEMWNRQLCQALTDVMVGDVCATNGEACVCAPELTALSSTVPQRWVNVLG